MAVQRKDRFSNKLIWFQFILSVMVVIIHVVNNSPRLPIETGVVSFFGNMVSYIGNIAVPCFFAISGFLFYWNFSWDKLLGKLKRRIFSLLIPFVVWNSLIYFAYLGLAQIPALHLDKMTFSLKEYISAVINSAYSPLWFIRTLVVYVLISPVIVFLWKREWIAIMTILVLLTASYLKISISFIGNYYLPFYLIGVYLAIFHPNVATQRSAGISRWAGTAGFAAMLLLAALYVPLELGENWLYTLRLLGVLSAWFALDWFNFESNPGTWLKASFPIYVMHCVFVKVGKTLVYHYLPHTWYVMLAEYILLPAITVMLIIGINYALNRNRYTKTAWRFILGNR